MEATAKLSYLRITPRKVRAVANLIRGQKVGAALNMLAYVEKRAAESVAKLLRSAVANAEEAAKKSPAAAFDADALTVKELLVDQGPTLRRFMPRAMGRAFRVNKKTSHISLTVSDTVVEKKKIGKKAKGAQKSRAIAARTAGFKPKSKAPKAAATATPAKA
ncbi:MAG: 50S ribosomal protein L22 [Deltaproteobacteria bacterium]|nr:50S ribosomal protein L22 [Deltaproteobacteria bacterium]